MDTSSSSVVSLLLDIEFDWKSYSISSILLLLKRGFMYSIKSLSNDSIDDGGDGNGSC